MDEGSFKDSTEVSRMSAVLQFGPGAVDDPVVKVKGSNTDLINRVQSEATVMKFGAGADEESFVKVNQLITDLKNKLQVGPSFGCSASHQTANTLEGVVDTMMANVYRAAGGGGDMPGDMSGGGFDDSPGASGNVNDVVVVSASRTGERSSQVQGTLLEVSRAEASRTRERWQTRSGERIRRGKREEQEEGKKETGEETKKEKGRDVEEEKDKGGREGRDGLDIGDEKHEAEEEDGPDFRQMDPERS